MDAEINPLPPNTFIRMIQGDRQGNRIGISLSFSDEAFLKTGHERLRTNLDQIIGHQTPACLPPMQGEGLSVNFSFEIDYNIVSLGHLALRRQGDQLPMVFPERGQGAIKIRL